MESFKRALMASPSKVLALAKALTPPSAKARAKADQQREAKKARRRLATAWKSPAARALELYEWLETIRTSDPSNLEFDWRAHVVGLLNERRGASKAQPGWVKRSENKLKHCWDVKKEPESGYVRVTIPAVLLKRALELGLPVPSDLKGGKATLSILVLLAAGRLPNNELAGGSGVVDSSIDGETSHVCVRLTICQRHCLWERRAVNQGRSAEGHVPGPGCGHTPSCIDPKSSSGEDAWVDWSIELLRESMEYIGPNPGSQLTVVSRTRSYGAPGPTVARERWKFIPSGVPLETLAVLDSRLKLLREFPPGSSD